MSYVLQRPTYGENLNYASDCLIWRNNKLFNEKEACVDLSYQFSALGLIFNTHELETVRESKPSNMHDAVLYKS